MIEQARLIDWLSRLVRIPSVTPAHAAGRTEIAGEGRFAAQLAAWFEQFGGTVVTEDVFPDRPNVYAIWRGQADRWIAVDIHMDTVGVEQMTGDPFDGRVENHRVYGRGAVDTKASLAVVLAMLETVHEAYIKLPANLMVVTTSAEEDGAAGAPVFANWVRRQPFTLDQLVVAEPTLCGPVYGHKGALNLEFRVEGRAAHSAQPEQGKNAVAAAAHLIVALEAEHDRLMAAPPETELGTGTLTVSLVQGGRALNIVPDQCIIGVNRRVVPGEARSTLLDGLTQLAQSQCPLPVAMSEIHFLDPFYQTPDVALVRQFAEWSGREPAVVPYATNAWAYNGLARETVILGPGSIDQAHGSEEWVEISELEKLGQLYMRWWDL